LPAASMACCSCSTDRRYTAQPRLARDSANSPLRRVALQRWATTFVGGALTHAILRRLLPLSQAAYLGVTTSTRACTKATVMP
jgi:hypothetical protein